MLSLKPYNDFFENIEEIVESKVVNQLRTVSRCWKHFFENVLDDFVEKLL